MASQFSLTGKTKKKKNRVRRSLRDEGQRKNEEDLSAGQTILSEKTTDLERTEEVQSSTFISTRETRSHKRNQSSESNDVDERSNSDPLPKRTKTINNRQKKGPEWTKEIQGLVDREDIDALHALQCEVY